MQIVLQFLKRSLYPLRQIFQGEHGTDWELLMAASVIATVPVLLVYFAAQRWFVQGIATSGFGGR